MSSGRDRFPKAVARAAVPMVMVWALAATPSHANPATVGYRCKPALPGGGPLSIDYNSGGKSITLFYPNGETLRMPIQRSGSGFRYGEGNVGIAGKGQTTITLQIAGQPARQCVTPR